MRKILELVFLILVCLCPSFAYADSDGYYCHNKNYVAYEFDGGITGKEKGHNLYIHFLSDASPLDNSIKIELENFQTHGMKCSKDVVVVRAWEALYTIDLKNRRSPQLKETENMASVSEQPLQGKNSSNLGIYASVGTFPIETISEKYSYALEVKVVSDKQVAEKGHIFHHTVSNLVRRTLDGEILDVYEIFKGVREESID